MAAPKGTVPPNAGKGRRAGIPNKRTREVEEKLAALGCDPITGMAMLAMDESNSPDLRGRMYAELAQYVAPKRRAIEHSGDINVVESLLLEIGAEE
jgi:hypothetical protein